MPSKVTIICQQPNGGIHTDPTRVIGRRTTCDSDEHPYLRGYEVVVIAVLRNGATEDDGDRFTTEAEVRAAGGVRPDDRLEVAPILPGKGLSFVTSDPRAIGVEGFSRRVKARRRQHNSQLNKRCQ